MKKNIFLFCLIVIIVLGSKAQTPTYSYVMHNNQPPVLVADAGSDTSIYQGSVVILGGNPTAIGGTPPFEYLWDPGWLFENAYDANPQTIDTIDVNLQPTLFYLYIVDHNICNSYDSVWVNFITGIDDNSMQNSNLQIYPIPASNTINIETDQSIDVKSIIVYDINGKPLDNYKTILVSEKNIRLEFHNISSGNYFIMLRYDNKIIVKKIIIY